MTTSFFPISGRSENPFGIDRSCRPPRSPAFLRPTPCAPDGSARRGPRAALDEDDDAGDLERRTPNYRFGGGGPESSRQLIGGLEDLPRRHPDQLERNRRLALAPQPPEHPDHDVKSTRAAVDRHQLSGLSQPQRRQKTWNAEYGSKWPCFRSSRSSLRKPAPLRSS